MKKQIAITSAVIFASSFIFAQTAKPKPPTAPATPFQFLGKTFEDCEKIVGKPLRIENPKGDERAFYRDYKATIPGVTKIELGREPQGAMDGPVRATVSRVTYYFPKGTAKTWKEAFVIIGLKSEGATQEDLGEIKRIEAPDFPKGWIQIQWTPSASTMTMPERYRHPNDDSLSFGGRMPTEQERQQISKPTPK